jgi:3',5'-cyclic AMP phosphodiesterase CpdA
MTATRVTVVSDTHLSERTPEASANWEAVLRHVATTQPDLVVHLGDLTVDGAHEPHELDRARAQLDRLSVPWRAVPGNHDIGDNPRPGLPGGHVVTAAAVDAWRSSIGPDWWSCDLANWTVIALNAQLFGSDLDAESRQWAWWDETLASVPATRPITVALHKPMTADDRELATAPPYRFAPAAARERIAAALAAHDVRLVLSGHVHQYRVLHEHGCSHVWTPTTWAVLPDEIQPTFGAKRCGLVSLGLTDLGEIEVELDEPPDLIQLTLGRDCPDPYDLEPPPRGTLV